MRYIESIKRIIFWGRHRRDNGKFELNTERDWLVLLVAFFLFILIILVYGAYAVFSVSKEYSYRSTDSVVQMETIDREKLKKTLEEYKQKELLFNEVLSGGVNKGSDPSL